ncbi:lysostaphin resistance A-like protein [Candidatus Omnitrophota bacterium]
MFQFLKRERIYILILFFILAVNVIKVKQAEEYHHDKKESFSEMSFEDIGLTEEKIKDFFESERPSARFFKYSIILGFLFFATIFILNLGLIVRRKKIGSKPTSSKRPVSWGLVDLVRATLLIMFIAYIITIIEGIAFKMFNLGMDVHLGVIINTFFIDIAAVVVILYFVMVKHKERLPAIGLQFSSFFKNILSGITVYVFIVPVLFVVLLLSIRFLNIFEYIPPPQPVFEMFMEEKENKTLIFLTIFVSVLGPIIEEMFFRGFMYSAIKKYLGILGAAFLSACIFSVLHTNIVGFLPIMILGIVLAYLYETTGSLVAPIAVHILHNSIIVGFVFFIKELIA